MRNPLRTAAAGALLQLTLVALPAIHANAGAPAPHWQVADVEQPGQWTIYNRTPGGAQFGFPLAAGDVNGDRLADLILTPMNADSGPNRDRTSAGEAMILLSAGVIAGERNLAELVPPALPADTTLIYGADPFDYLGTQVAAADLDGDGFADAIIGAQYGDGANNSRANCGEIAIIWGHVDIGGQVIDLRTPPAGAVTFIYGAHSGDRLGVWVSSADVDGDGIVDATLGADLASPDVDRIHAGTTYVVYGGAALRAASALDLAAPDLPVTAITGIDRGDQSGATVRGHDFNGDGAAEVLIGAGLNRLSAAVGPTGNFDGSAIAGGDGPNNVCSPVALDCWVGEAYIVYSERGARPALIDLAHPPPTTTIIYGIDRGDAYGEELYAGDFNGDGWVDLAIGALTANGPDNTRQAAGELALILGGPTLEGSVIDLSHPPAGVTFFYGAHPSAIAGDTISLLDLDGDGKDELVIACPDDEPVGRPEAGNTYIFFGTAAPLPAAVDLLTVPSDLTYIVVDGATDNDMLAYSMSTGDVNGDGHPDLVQNVMGGDGFHDLLFEAGDTIVLDAVALTRFAGREPVSVGTPRATATATATQPTPAATPTVTPITCGGDCDGNGIVTIGELITAVRIALSVSPVTSCLAADLDMSGAVEINELISAVGRALSGCSAAAAG